MRKIELEQGSPEWLLWRKGLITATEAGSIMGVNPYCTVYKSWQRKLGLVSEQAETEPMRRGKRDEPIARDLFNKQHGIEMVPCCIESEQYNFLGASLDGLSPCGKYLLEIKSQSPHYIESRGIPEYHMAQMQHQMLCSDGMIQGGFYVSHFEGKNLVYEIQQDSTWMKSYLEKAAEYWKCVVFFEAPEMSSKDYKSMECDLAWASSASHYRRICAQIKDLEEQKEKHRKDLIAISGNENCFGSGVKVTQSIMKGRIDYDLIHDLKNIDLEQYRKPRTISWKVLCS